MIGRIYKNLFRKRTKEEMEYIDSYCKQPDKVFDRYFSRTGGNKKQIEDVDTISPDWKQFESTYHYNLVESGIIDILRKYKINIDESDVLDVGAGSGHWVDFYLNILKVKSVTGIDFSQVAITNLKNRYVDEDRVEILKEDISNKDLLLNKKYDIISAIGVIFHIVDDRLWMQTLSNFAKLCNQNNLVIIGGDFKKDTKTVHPSVNINGPVRRIRSLKYWKKILRENSCEILEVKYFNWFKGWNGKSGIMENLLVFRKMR